jgi:ABC-type dipeptide/oligopeptide/nickel transport system permease component
VQRYILGRLRQSIVSRVVVSIGAFALVRFSGDPVRIIASPEASEQDIGA